MPTPDVPVPEVVVVGLGPGAPGLLTMETLAAIESIPDRWLRTSHHPSASAVPGASTFDYLYEEADDLAQVYTGIVDVLVAAAARAPSGRVLYAVPGSPSVAERSVELLRADPRARTVVLPAVSFADLAFDRLGVDPLAAGARILDGHRFTTEAAGYQGPVLIGQCDSLVALSEVKMAIGAVLEATAAAGAEVQHLTVLQRLGLPDENVARLPWYDLDRVVRPDHLTSVWVPALGLPFAPEMAKLEELARTLRAKCPWDRQQTHQSLTRYLIEESYEVLEAIDELTAAGPGAGGYEHLEEELGDVLFQVFFHSTLAAEEGQFSVADVARNVHDKLVGRHPHVFGDVQADTPDQVMKNWEQIKRKEKGRTGTLDGVPANLPSLLYAHKVQVKAASVGFDWDGAGGAMQKVAEELAELAELLPAGQDQAPQDQARLDQARLDQAPQDQARLDQARLDQARLDQARLDEELGDLLFAVVNAARHLRVDPEAALRGAAAKFRRRFVAVESLVAERGLVLASMGLAALDALWDEVKASEPTPAGPGHARRGRSGGIS